MKFFLRCTLKILKYFSIFLLTLFVIWFVLALYHRINVRRVCVELPNGLRIGYAAVFDLQEFVWEPDIVLKLPNGTTLTTEHVESFYFTETTVYGHAGPRFEPQKDYAFLYRTDVGLILEKDEPERYERLKKAAGQIIWIRGNLIHTNLMGTYYKGIEKPAYIRSKCTLSLFPEGQGFDFNKIWYPFKKMPKF